jgi:hypothetical protein
MNNLYEFELVFELPSGNHSAYSISDSIFEAGFEDAVIGTGHPSLVGVELEVIGSSAEDAILGTARSILSKLPHGSQIREIRPDLVSLADVAEKMNVKRQALQKRKELPLPVMGGLYRIDEMADVIMKPSDPAARKRKPRFDLERVQNWFSAGIAARKLNAQLTMHLLDPVTMTFSSDKKATGVNGIDMPSSIRV